MARMSRRQKRLLSDLKAFNLLRRDDDGMWGPVPRTRFDYGEEVGTGLGSATMVAPALWIARQFPEAPIAIEDQDGTLNYDHPIVQLFRKPNQWYGGGALKMAIALDYTISGNAYIEIERGTGGRPTALYYQPSYAITPKGNKSELVTHYLQTVQSGQRRIERENMIHIRNGIDPENNRRGYAPLQSLVREIFTDDEAANMTAAVLRNYGVPGVVISPSSEDASFGPEQGNTIKQFFNRLLRGDNRGQAIVMGNGVKIDKFDVDFARMNIDRLRQIPEERVCAVLGVPAAVVGFGTGMEQTKVGATLKELRELAYENVIVPMQRNFVEEFDRVLLPEFEPKPKLYSVVFDNSKVRVFQEDENAKSVRVRGEWQSGLISRAEARATLGREVQSSDDVYQQSFTTILVPVNQAPIDPRQPKHMHVQTKGAAQAQDFRTRLDSDVLRLSAAWANDIERKLVDYANEVAKLYQQNAKKFSDAQKKAEADQQDQDLVNLMLLGLAVPSFGYEDNYLNIAKSTARVINVTYEIGVGVSDDVAKAVVSRGGIRKGLIDLTEETRQTLFSILAESRDKGWTINETAKAIKETVGAGPWGSKETRSQIVARAETKYAQNVSSNELYMQSDKVKNVEIMDALNGDVHDDYCLELAGQVVTKEQAALIDPLQHPNCSRTFVPVIE